MARGLSSGVKKFSLLGEKPGDIVFRTINLIFFVMAVFFAAIYFIIVATNEIENTGEDNAGSTVSTYIGVIGGSCLTLTMLELYSSLNSMLRLIRVALIIILIVFVSLSISKVTHLAEEATGTSDAQIALQYTFASLTLGFAAVAALLNFLEMARNVGRSS